LVADVSVRGAEKLAILARALREVGDKELQRELYRGLNRAVKPLTADVKQSTGQYLPARYARELSRDLKVTSRRRVSAGNPALYLLGGAKNRDVRSLNRGRLRHPLYGNRLHWYNQRVTPGWWSQVLAQGAPQVRDELERTLDELARKVARRVR
jgi:hypothetical protein